MVEVSAAEVLPYLSGVVLIPPIWFPLASSLARTPAAVGALAPSFTRLTYVHWQTVVMAMPAPRTSGCIDDGCLPGGAGSSRGGGGFTVG
jgi:hypothetical protein